MATINGTEGTVTISLGKYHQWLELEKTVETFRKDKTTILACSGFYGTDYIYLMRPTDAVLELKERMDRQIATLEKEIQDLKAGKEQKRHFLFRR